MFRLLEDLNNITQGIYNVIITDLYKCKTEKTFVVNAPEESLKLNFDVKHVTCKGGSDGNIITSATCYLPLSDNTSLEDTLNKFLIVFFNGSISLFTSILIA